MFGTIVLVVVLLASPFIITLSLAAVAAVLGNLLVDDAEARHADSPLIDANY